ncbi:30S ribosomal protein S1 [PVC group bacterium (ex Bugula neritina AB1)]|nr:30S ribosomal protein S1 [PVC group bacterium (ex Bugula neritina AB1)]
MVDEKPTFDLDIFLKDSQDNLPSMDDLLEDTHPVHEGEITSGKILSYDKSEVMVDIGYKSEGIVSRHEFEGDDSLEIGRELEFLVESLEDSEGRVLLSKTRADKIKEWDAAVSRLEEGAVVEGRVVRKIKGGLIVDVGIDSFLPASQVDVRPVLSFDDLIGKTFSFKIVKINLKRKNIVVSRREILEEKRSKGREELLSKISIGDLRQGTVKNITDFGVFVDLGGLDGLLHITDMSWGRINHPSQVVAIGDSIEVMVLNIDKERARVSLGIKQKTENPWVNIAEKYPVNAKVSGKVVKLAHYGAFVELEEGVETLLHISEMSWTRRVSHPSEILKIDDEIEAVVLSVSEKDHKLSLGLKQTKQNPWDRIGEDFAVGMKVSGRVRNITDYGAFVEICEGIDGLVHVSDMSWTRRVNHPSEVLKKGDDVQAIVLSVDSENRKVALGIKQLIDDPWKTSIMEYTKGQQIEGQVVKITKFGIFVGFDDSLEGLIHSSQLESEGQKLEDLYKQGDDITAYISKVDTIQRKISLSMKPSLGNNA